jgi:hypothetical protein
MWGLIGGSMAEFIGRTVFHIVRTYHLSSDRDDGTL